MNQLKRYYWYGKSMLRTVAVQVLLYVLAFGIVNTFLDVLGAGNVVKTITLVPLFLGFVVWTGLKLRANQMPGELDILAKQDDSPNAATIIEMLEGNPSIKDANVNTLVSGLFEGTKTPRKRDQFWSSIDAGTGEVYERLFGLYSQYRNDRLLLVIERLTRDAPLEATAYEEMLFEELDSAPEDDVVMLDDWRSRRQSSWTIPALILAHISRENTAIADRATPRIIELLDPQGDQFEMYAVLALGELAAHDDSAEEKVRELRDSRVAALRNAAGDILAHYEDSDHPYPAGQRLDEFDVKHEEKHREWERDTQRAMQEWREDDEWWEDDDW